MTFFLCVCGGGGVTGHQKKQAEGGGWPKCHVTFFSKILNRVARVKILNSNAGLQFHLCTFQTALIYTVFHQFRQAKFTSLIWSVFHQFRQTKFAYGGSILSSSHFFLLPQRPLKTKLAIKVVKIDSKIIILPVWSESVKQTEFGFILWIQS